MMISLTRPSLSLTRICLPLAALLVLLAGGCAQHAEEPAARPTPVRAFAAQSGPGSPAVETNGVVETKDEMRLSFNVAGVIRRISVQEGETVKRGQRLAEIELAEIDAQVEQAKELASKAQRDLERGERLYGDQVISLEQLQDLRTQAALSKARLRGADFNRGHSVISAPQDGVVLRKFAQESELVPAGQPVLSLGAHGRGYVVRAALADREIVQFKLGDPAQIRMDAFPGRKFAGEISEIASAADERSGMFPIEVRIDAPSGSLASGLVAKLLLHPASARSATLTYVPIAAVVEGDRDRASVFVLAGDRAKRRAVHIAFFAPEAVALSEGVAPGERVVTDGALYLEDNERIEVIEDASRPVAGDSLVRPAAPATG